MTKMIKTLALLGQIIFAWLYAFATNSCNAKSCSANSYFSFALIMIFFLLFDFYFLGLLPRFKKISKTLFKIVILLFPVLFYVCGIILNLITKKSLSVIIAGIILILLSRALWIALGRIKMPPVLIEYLALNSLFLLILGLGFLAANLNFAISSYLKYASAKNDSYIVENHGIKSNFINYRFR